MKLFNLYTKPQTLEQLIVSCQKEERKAQKELYERFAPTMLGVCRRYVKHLEIAEEMLSNGFIKAFRYINNFEGKGSFEGWLRKIMIRECLDYLKTEKDWMVSVDTFLPSMEPSQDAATDLETEELLALIDELPAGYKEIFNLYVIEGMKHHEIATLLNISENTSKTQLMKARLALQKRIEEINYINI